MINSVRRTALYVAGAILATCALASCSSSSAEMCPVSNEVVSGFTGGEVTSEFNDFKGVAEYPDRNDRNCIYSVKNGELGSFDMLISWTPDSAYYDLALESWSDERVVEDFPVEAFLQAPSGTGVDPSLDGFNVLWQKDGYIWQAVIFTIEDSDVFTPEMLATAASLQAIDVARAVTQVTFDSAWWDK